MNKVEMVDLRVKENKFRRMIDVQQTMINSLAESVSQITDCVGLLQEQITLMNDDAQSEAVPKPTENGDTQQ